MPIYDYQCACGEVFEEYNPYMNDDPMKCPDCGQKAPRIHARNQKLKQPRYVRPPLAKKKWGEKGRVPHKPARW